MAHRYLKADLTSNKPVWAEPNETDLFLNGKGQWARMDLTIDENPWSVDFKAGYSGVTLASGIYNKGQTRLEC